MAGEFTGGWGTGTRQLEHGSERGDAESPDALELGRIDLTINEKRGVAKTQVTCHKVG